jgi:hypothetical protein
MTMTVVYLGPTATTISYCSRLGAGVSKSKVTMKFERQQGYIPGKGF